MRDGKFGCFLTHDGNHANWGKEEKAFVLVCKGCLKYTWGDLNNRTLLSHSSASEKSEIKVL